MHKLLLRLNKVSPNKTKLARSLRRYASVATAASRYSWLKPTNSKQISQKRKENPKVLKITIRKTCIKSSNYMSKMLGEHP